MLHDVLLTVTLKVPDNEARSALEAVRVKMGLAGDVLDLRRDDLWELSLESASEDAAVEAIERLVGSTNLFANPNKHRHTVRAATRSPGNAASTRPEDRESASGNASDGLADNEVAVLVADRGSAAGDAITGAVRRAGGPGLASARRWTRWTVTLSRPARVEDPDVMALVERIAVARERASGLLSNPHSQVCRVAFSTGAERILTK